MAYGGASDGYRPGYHSSSPGPGPGQGPIYGGHTGSSSSPYPPPNVGPPGGGGGYFPPHQSYGGHTPSPGAGPWVPGTGTSTNPPPAVPPRPPQQHSPYGRPPTTAGGPNFPLASTSGGGSAIGFAMNAVDKFAGRKTREQIEAAGSKLFGKFK
ncbi:hypothetical protein NP233_g3327 [Leucocoprinus birnbaumii]|uniref:Uncharacterized protein n=1 Tax=Leucocoprinus birnbaumii TaxID=56174 RepID=A0AAD5VZD4_9AGAR|nr:hypothetical protein NP233_g3327 [Leucocoprinus birnbaumii]